MNEFIMVIAFNKNDEVSIKKVQNENHYNDELKFLKYYNWAKLIKIETGKIIKQNWSSQ